MKRLRKAYDREYQENSRKQTAISLLRKQSRNRLQSIKTLSVGTADDNSSEGQISIGGVNRVFNINVGDGKMKHEDYPHEVNLSGIPQLHS